MKNNTLIIVAIIFSLVTFFISKNYTKFINYIIDNYSNKADTVYTTKIEWKHDSIEIIKPIPKYVEKVRIDTVYDEKHNPIELITENKKYQDTITTCAGDTMEVMSYISGINVVQDSLKVKLSKREITKTETITKYITPKKKFLDHFKIGIGVGYGYGFSSKQFEPYAGISLNYNF